MLGARWGLAVPSPDRAAGAAGAGVAPSIVGSGEEEMRRNRAALLGALPACFCLSACHPPCPPAPPLPPAPPRLPSLQCSALACIADVLVLVAGGWCSALCWSPPLPTRPPSRSTRARRCHWAQAASPLEVHLAIHSCGGGGDRATTTGRHAQQSQEEPPVHDAAWYIALSLLIEAVVHRPWDCSTLPRGLHRTQVGTSSLDSVLACLVDTILCVSGGSLFPGSLQLRGRSVPRHYGSVPLAARVPLAAVFGHLAAPRGLL
eukprot:COSAG01_NODE_580_length_15231_cov_6.793220_17_plen_261_part_00